MGYEPSPAQEEIHRTPERRVLAAGGEGGGKSYLIAQELVPHVLFPIDRPEQRVFWIVGDTFKEPQEEFNIAVESLSRLKAIKPGSLMKPEQRPWKFTTIAGNLVKTFSAHDPETIRAESPSGVVIAECAQLQEDAFKRIDARLARTRGFLLASGTLELSSHWYTRLVTQGLAGQIPDFRTFTFPSWANTHVYPLGEYDPGIEIMRQAYSEEEFNLRVRGVPTPPSHRVLRSFDPQIHIVAKEFSKDRPVYLWIDPGSRGAYAVEVVQIYGEPGKEQVYVFDEIYVQYHTTQQVIAMCRERPWWQNVRGGVIDIFGGVRTSENQRTARQTWAQAGVRLGARKVSRIAGLETLQGWLMPASGGARLFVAPKCKGALTEAGCAPPPFRGTGTWFHKKDSSGNILEEPEGANNHAWSALIYGLVHHFGYAGRRKRPKPQMMEYSYGVA